MAGTLSLPSVPRLFVSACDPWPNIKKTQREYTLIRMVRHSVVLRECFLLEHQDLSKVIFRLIHLFAFILKRMTDFSSLGVFSWKMQVNWLHWRPETEDKINNPSNRQALGKTCVLSWSITQKPFLVLVSKVIESQIHSVRADAKGDRDKAVKPGGRCENITPLRTLLPYNVAAEDVWSAEEEVKVREWDSWIALSNH